MRITHSGAGRKSRRAAGFLLHTFLSPSKEKCERPIGLQALLPRRSRRAMLQPRQGVCAYRRTKGLSSGQTIAAVRTAGRSACCLPELRVANRLRRLYPLGTRSLSAQASVCGSPFGAVLDLGSLRSPFREKALDCPFCRRGSQRRAHYHWLANTNVRARSCARHFPPSK